MSMCTCRQSMRVLTAPCTHMLTLQAYTASKTAPAALLLLKACHASTQRKLFEPCCFCVPPCCPDVPRQTEAEQDEAIRNSVHHLRDRSRNSQRSQPCRGARPCPGCKCRRCHVHAARAASAAAAAHCAWLLARTSNSGCNTNIIRHQCCWQY
jgi:hypothetical protein